MRTADRPRGRPSWARCVGAALGGAVLLGACSTAAVTTTCRDYERLGAEARSQVVADLLRRHGLDADAVVNQVALTAAVDGHCGTGPTSRALRNPDDRVDQAVDWSAATW